MGNDDGIRYRAPPRRVTARDTGDDLPESSGDPSGRILDVASRSPVAFAFEEPIAGATFWPSVLPTCNRCTAWNVDELEVETMDSVGLSGRSMVGGISVEPRELLASAGTTTEELWWLWVGLKEEVDPFIAANLRRRSSNGAPVLPWSDPFGPRWGLRRGARVAMSIVDRRDGGDVMRDERGTKSDMRVFTKMVSGATPSFMSSTSPILFKLFSASAS
jgi:hypothetical protein